MWPWWWTGPQRYRSLVSGGQARDAIGRAAGKGGVSDDDWVGSRAAVDRDKVWEGRVGRRAAFNRGKVWLAWSDQQGFVEGCGGQGSSPCRGRGRVLLGPRRY